MSVDTRPAVVSTASMDGGEGTLHRNVDLPPRSGLGRAVDRAIFRIRNDAPRRGRPWLTPVIVCYLAVLLFAGAFILLSWLANQRMWPAGWPTLSRTETLVAAGFVAVPLLVGLAWQRMTGVKFAGFEVSLAAAQAKVDRSLPAEVMNDVQGTLLGSSGRKDIKFAIAKADTLLEVDLSAVWWSTRLYLLAALADDYSRVARITFVNNARPGQRAFIGIARPHSVRRAMSLLHNGLEKAYRQARANVLNQPPMNTETEVDAVIRELSNQMTGLMQEDVIHQLIEVQSAPEKLGMAFEGGAMVNWDDESDAMLQYLVVRQAAPYVVVVRDGRVDQVVDRCALTGIIARRDLQSRVQA